MSPILMDFQSPRMIILIKHSISVDVIKSWFEHMHIQVEGVNNWMDSGVTATVTVQSLTIVSHWQNVLGGSKNQQEWMTLTLGNHTINYLSGNLLTDNLPTTQTLDEEYCRLFNDLPVGPGRELYQHNEHLIKFLFLVPSMVQGIIY